MTVTHAFQIIEIKHIFIFPSPYKNHLSHINLSNPKPQPIKQEEYILLHLHLQLHLHLRLRLHLHCLRVMSPMINADDLHRIFKNLDKKNKGVVGIDELHGLLGRIGVHTTPGELEKFVGRTTLDYFEFLFFYEAMVKASKPEHEHEHEKDLRKAFEVFDLNGDGYISSEELRSVLSRLGLLDNEKRGGAEDCECMIGVYDDNSDGVLDFHEFKNMMSVRGFRK